MAADVAGDLVLAKLLLTSFIAAKIGRSGQPMQKLGGRGGTDFASSFTLGSARTVEASGGGGELPSRFLPCSSRKALMPLVTTWGVYSPAIGSTSLPLILVWMSRRRRMVFSACSMNSG